MAASKHSRPQKAHKSRITPDASLLKSILRYEPETGHLYWRARKEAYFSDRGRGAAVNCRLWNSKLADKRAFTCAHPHGYLTGRIFGESWLAHRIIWKMMTETEPMDIDHINGNPSDNRWANLRSVSASENNRNFPLPSNNTSGVIGVHWCNIRQKWYARIHVTGRTICLGYFDSLDEAKDARKSAEQRHGFHVNHGRDSH